MADKVFLIFILRLRLPGDRAPFDINVSYYVDMNISRGILGEDLRRRD
jgi:hypothetical protein